MRVVLALLLFLAAGHAGAVSGRIDFYGTSIRNDSASLTLERRSLFGGSTIEAGEVDAGARPEIGLRTMLYGNEMPVVGGIDLSVLKTGSPQLDLIITEVALVGGLRMPTPLLAHHGRGLHPYVLAGIAVTGCEGTVELGSIRTDVYAGSSLLSARPAEASPFLAAGFDWQVSDRFGVVLEYRHRRIDFESISTNSFLFPTENIFASGRIDTSGTSIGISWLFDATGSVPAKMPRQPSELSTP